MEKVDYYRTSNWGILLGEWDVLCTGFFSVGETGDILSLPVIYLIMNILHIVNIRGEHHL